MVPPVRLTNALGAQRIDQLVTKDSIGASAGIMIRFDSSSYIWREMNGFDRFSLSVLRDERTISFM